MSNNSLNLPFLAGVTTNETLPAPYTNGGTAIDLSSKEDKANKGIANGYAPLDVNAKVPVVNLPDAPAHDEEVDAKITTHNSDSTAVHGITDTANLVLTTDSRIVNIAGGSINTSGLDGSVGGSINTSGGGNGGGGSINTSDSGGSINTAGGEYGVGGFINLSNNGGSIVSSGGNGNAGGSLNMSGGGSINTSVGGGSINTSDGGGSITTSNGGGSINTTGVGSIQLGVDGARTTLNGSANANQTITLPNGTGTIALTNDPRLTNARAPRAHNHGNIQNDGKIGFSGGIVSADMMTVGGGSWAFGTFAVVQGNASGGVIVHSANGIVVTSAGTGYVNGEATANGSAYTITAGTLASPNLPLITTTGGAVTTGEFGTTANTFCQGSDFQAHLDDSTEVHGIYNTAYLAYKEDSSNIFHRNLLGWPSASMISARGTEQSFHNYGSLPTLFDGTEGWLTTSRPIYYVPIFIKNTVSGMFTLRIPIKNYAGHISAALFAGDNYNATAQPTSNGHMTLVANFGGPGWNAEYESAQFTPASVSVRRGWHFIALSFSANPTGKVYRSVYSPNGPTIAEQMFGMQQRRSFIEDTTEKQRRIGSVIRRVDGQPTWPPATSTAPKLFNYVENPVTPKLIFQFNGPDGSVAVNEPMTPWPTFSEPSIDSPSIAIQRFNDASYPTTPTLLSFASASPQGGYNLLASAVAGALNTSTSTRFQIDFSSTAHVLTDVRFYTRSTSTGPTSLRVIVNSGTASPYNTTITGLSTAGTWQQQVINGIMVSSTPLSASFQLQIFGYGGSATAASGNWRIDNIEIRGTYRIPESPASWAGMSPSTHFFGFSEVVPLFYWGFDTLISSGSSSV